jgi:glycosyltransferase involved in cell wall biosynthesis
MVPGVGLPLRVLGTSAHGPNDPSFRVRIALPGRALVAQGILVEELPLFSVEQARRFRAARGFGKATALAQARRRLSRELRDGALDASVVLVQQRIDLGPSLGLERLATRDRRLIYDIDDAAWLSGRQTAGHYLNFLKGSGRKVRWLAERAAHIVAGSEILAEYLTRYDRPTTVVPSLIEPSGYPTRLHEQGSTITLGWIGSATTARYLQRVGPILERFAQQVARPVRLVVVGGAAPRLRGVEIEERVWSTESELRALSEMDIGLMPLEDTPWSRGKCAYKALQYMASGIPPLVSDVGISAKVVAGAGYVAAEDAGWLDGLHTLAQDADLRMRLGAVGRRRVEQHFSFARWLPVLAEIMAGKGESTFSGNRKSSPAASSRPGISS